MLKTVDGHLLFRIAVALVSLVFTGSLLLAVARNTSFMSAYAPISQVERIQARLAVSLFSMPFAIGVLGVFPIRWRSIRVLGLILAYGVSPSLLAALVMTHCVEFPSELFFVLTSWNFFAMVFWHLRSEPCLAKNRNSGTNLQLSLAVRILLITVIVLILTVTARFVWFHLRYVASP